MPRWLLLALALSCSAVGAGASSSCKECATWNEPQRPFRVYGNTWYVGVHGLSSILITSNRGHILIDGDLPESAPRIAASIRELGFRVEDVKLILNSHVHFDHAGGIAELQQLSGASVAASAPSAKVLQAGRSGPDDPQFHRLPPIAPVRGARVIEDNETLRVGPLAVTAHLTPGHTPGGTSWSWKSCEKERCLDIAYVDSLAPVSDDSFRFSSTADYPGVLEDFAKSFATVSSLPCDILLTPHPDSSDLWGRLAKRDHGAADALVDRDACRRLAGTAQERLAERVSKEKG